MARLRIDIHAELICPWCQIGKRHFERARAELLADMPALPIEVHWHLQTLLPDLPEDGLPFQPFYERRLGSAAAVAARQAQVRAAGRPVGLDFAFERIERMPHTGLAHALLADAREQLGGAAFEQLMERLFAAHFQQGESLSDLRLLAALADDFGVRPSANARPPAQAARPAPGVPYFVFNDRYAISGARESAQLLDVMRQALAR